VIGGEAMSAFFSTVLMVFDTIEEFVGFTLYIFLLYVAIEIVFLVRYPRLRREVDRWERAVDEVFFSLEKYEQLGETLANFFKGWRSYSRLRGWEGLYAFVTKTSILVGVLGTFLGISAVFTPTGIQDKTLLVQGAQNAMWSTVIGIVIGIVNCFLDVQFGWGIVVGVKSRAERWEHRYFCSILVGIARIVSGVDELKDLLVEVLYYGRRR